MKKYRVYIDISESMDVEANSEEEARQKVLDLLDDNNTTWTPDDAEILVEEDV